MIKKKDLTQEDKKIWESYIKNPSDIYDKDKGISDIQIKKDRFKFDLHGFTLDDANNKVREIVTNCVSQNYKEILLITGKGIHSKSDEDTYVSKDLGKLRFSVPEFLKNDELLSNYILSIEDAQSKDGGGGAIIIKLKNLKNKL